MQAQLQVDSGNAGQLTHCYHRQLSLDATLSGRIEMEWVVLDGRVTHIEMFANTTGSDAFEECLAGKIRRWRFSDDVSGVVLYPFVFRLAG